MKFRLAIFTTIAFVSLFMTDSIAAFAAMPCDGEWKISLERRTRPGQREDYVGKMKVDNGKYSFTAQAGIYQMISEGNVSQECKIEKGLLRFQNRPDTYYLDIPLSGNSAKGQWYSTSGARWDAHVSR